MAGFPPQRRGPRLVGAVVRLVVSVVVFFCGLGLARGSAVAGGPRIQPEEARKQLGKEKEEKDKARANLYFCIRCDDGQGMGQDSE